MNNKKEAKKARDKAIRVRLLARVAMQKAAKDARGKRAPAPVKAKELRWAIDDSQQLGGVIYGHGQSLLSKDLIGNV